MGDAKARTHRLDPKVPILIPHAKLGGLAKPANTFPYLSAHDCARPRDPLALGEITRPLELGKPHGIRKAHTLKIRKSAIGVALFKAAQRGAEKIRMEEVVC